MPTLRSIPNDATDAFGTAEYLWVKNGLWFAKTRVITVKINKRTEEVVPIIEWWTTFDTDEELLMLPAHYVPHPLRPKHSFLVLCEARNLKDVVMPWNTRAPLRERERPLSVANGLWLGLETHVTITPADKADAIMETFLATAIDAGILVHSVGPNWFKIGPRMAGGLDADQPTPLIVCDHYWLAWYFLAVICATNGAKAEENPSHTYYVSTTTSRAVGGSKVAKKLAANLQTLTDAKVYITAPERGFTTVRGVGSSDDPYIAVTHLVDDIMANLKPSNSQTPISDVEPTPITDETPS